MKQIRKTRTEIEKLERQYMELLHESGRRVKAAEEDWKKIL